MRLILARHGQTGANVARQMDSATPGAELTELGLEQAQALADQLGREPIEVIYVSTLTRTQQTAAPLAAALDLEPRVREGIARGHRR